MLPDAVGVPGACASPPDLVVDDEEVVGPADAPPEGLPCDELVDVVGGACDEDDVVVVAGVLVVGSVVVGDDELLVVVAGDVWAVPEEDVLGDEPPQPATTRTTGMSVSAARARVSFEVKACLLPGQAEMAGVLGA